jgi:UDP-galactopyranose mutase
VYLFLNRNRVSSDHWLYFPDKDIVFNRAVEFSNWSELMCPKGKTSICFDITTFDGDAVDQMDDAALTRRTIHDAARIGFIDPGDVGSSLVVRVPYAYPFYDLGYKEKIRRVVAFLEDEHTYLLGRTGIFRYNNSDNSIEMGFELAEHLLAGRTHTSMADYRIRAVSL